MISRIVAAAALFVLGCGGSEPAAEAPKAAASATASASASAPASASASASAPAPAVLPDDPCVRLCEVGRLPACWEAVAHMMEANVDVSIRRALLERTCEKGFARACMELGFGANDTKRLERACELGSGISCLHRVNQADEGAMPPLSPEATRKTLERACAGESGIGCEKLGRLLEQDPPEKRDLTRIRETYQRACDNFGIDGCRWIQKEAKDGKLGQFARSVYEPACKRNEPWACVGLADRDIIDSILNKPKNGDEIRAEALARFSQACQNGYRWGCVRYGTLLVTGKAGKRDVEAGLALLRSHCIEAYEPACNQLSEFKEPPPSACVP